MDVLLENFPSLFYSLLCVFLSLMIYLLLYVFIGPFMKLSPSCLSFSYFLSCLYLPLPICWVFCTFILLSVRLPAFLRHDIFLFLFKTSLFLACIHWQLSVHWWMFCWRIFTLFCRLSMRFLFPSFVFCCLCLLFYFLNLSSSCLSLSYFLSCLFLPFQICWMFYAFIFLSDLLPAFLRHGIFWALLTERYNPLFKLFSSLPFRWCLNSFSFIRVFWSILSSDLSPSLSFFWTMTSIWFIRQLLASPQTFLTFLSPSVLDFKDAH